MARKIVHQLDHEVELRESLGELFFVRLVCFKIVIQSLYGMVSRRAHLKGKLSRADLEKSQERVTESLKNVVDLNV